MSETVTQIKLISAANDANLVAANELLFNVLHAPNTSAERYNQIDISAVNGPVTLTIIGDGYFTNFDRSENFGSSKTIEANESESVYLSNGVYSISVTDKRYVQKLIFNPDINNNAAYSNFSCNISQFRGMPVLTELQLNGMKVSGNYNRALNSDTSLVKLGLVGVEVYGSLNELKSAIPGLEVESLPTTDGNTTLKFDIKNAANNRFTIAAADSNVLLTLSNDFYFTNNDRSANEGQTKIIAAGSEEEVQFVGTQSGVLTISNAQYVSKLLIGNNMSTSSFDVSQMSNMTRLTEFTYYSNWDVYGSIGALMTSPNLEVLDVSSTSVIGDLSTFRVMTNLRELNISKSAVGGDIRHFNDLTKLEVLNLKLSGAHGTCIAFRKLTNLAELNIADTAIFGSRYFSTLWNSSCIITGTSAGHLTDDNEPIEQYPNALALMFDDSDNQLTMIDSEGNLHVKGNVYAANIGKPMLNESTEELATLLDADENKLAWIDEFGNLHFTGNVSAANFGEYTAPADSDSYLSTIIDSSGQEITNFDEYGNFHVTGNIYAANI